MRVPAKLYLVDDKPELSLEDGTTFDHRSIGYIAIHFVPQSHDYILEPITRSDIDFIIDNDIDIELEMFDEFDNPDEYMNVPLFEGERKPKLHKNKIIIHYK